MVAKPSWSTARRPPGLLRRRSSSGNAPHDAAYRAWIRDRGDDDTLRLLHLRPGDYVITSKETRQPSQ